MSPQKDNGGGGQLHASLIRTDYRGQVIWAGAGLADLAEMVWILFHPNDAGEVIEFLNASSWRVMSRGAGDVEILSGHFEGQHMPTRRELPRARVIIRGHASLG